MKAKLSGLIVVFCAVVCLLLGGQVSVRAQNPDSDNFVFDTPDTEYSEGAQATDPAVERTLPVSQKYRAFLPVSVDFASRMPPVGNQGKSSSCAAWSTAYAARSFYTGALEGRDLHSPANLPSPKYVFHLAREGKCEDGTNIPRVVQVLRNGALSLADYPFTPECTGPAPPALVAKAHDFKVRGLYRVNLNTMDDFKGQLARSNPVIIRLHDSVAFQRHRGAGAFSELPSNPHIKYVGWHFVTLVGYDDRRQAFHMINSWGTGWGASGFAWISYDVVKTRVTHAYALDVIAPPRPVAVAQRLEERPKPSTTPPALPQKSLSIPPPVSSPAIVSAKPTPQAETIPAITHTTETPPEPQPEQQVKAKLADLQSVACAKLDVQRQGNRNAIVGYVGSESDLVLVKKIAADVPNTVLGNVAVAPWPQCEALQTLEKPLATIGQPQIALGSKQIFRKGENLLIEITSPPQISYLYIAYIQADGSVVNLAQPEGIVPQPTMPNQIVKFGDGRDGRASFTVDKPFGREMVIAIASRSPLFDAELPAQQTEREYLTALRRALIYKPSPDLPDREVAAAVKMIETKEN